MREWLPLVFVTIFGVKMTPAALAQQFDLPEHINQIALSESIAGASSPMDLSGSDFQILPLDGKVDPEIKVEIGQQSLQWVRVGQILVVPRGLLLIQAQNVRSASVKTSKVTLSLHAKNQTLVGETPILLMSGKNNPIEITFEDTSGRLKKRIYVVRFRPRLPENNGKVITDVSCSPYQVMADLIQPQEGSWAYVGCRYVHRGGNEYNVPTLELFIYWDGDDSPVTQQGLPIEAPSASIWVFSQRAKPGKIELQRNQTQLKLTYIIAERDRRFFLGVGLGPYQYYFQDKAKTVNTVAPLITGYWALRTGDTTRIVGFLAAPVHSNSFADVGLYLSTEQVRIMDEHFSLNLLLGGHAIGFFDDKSGYFPVSFPQGFELIYRDFLGKRRNLSAGGFIYPSISGRSYYNVWLRWGSPALFGELNYISWKEPSDKDRSVYSRSAGVSVGFPLASLF